MQWLLNMKISHLLHKSNNSQRVNIYRSSFSQYLLYDWLLENTWEIIDSSYQLSDHDVYQIDKVSGLG